jgi:hypothetical protein
MKTIAGSQKRKRARKYSTISLNSVGKFSTLKDKLILRTALSRDLYKTSVRQQALRISLNEIADSQTQGIANALSKWPYIEIFLFLLELLKCMPTDVSGLG